MDEAEPTTEATDPQPPLEKEAIDFSALRGFQVVRAIEGENDASERREDWIAALRLELEARAMRLSESVDSALVLANDGVIRWLGDPIAKLAQGGSLFAPNVVVLADEALSEEGRLNAKSRIELWTSAYLRRLLGSLLELGNLLEGSEVVRDVAGLLAQSMGVLEREPIKSKITGLDQEARGELRKHGVRFGAYYIYLPALLKPAARALALHLAGLRASDARGSSLVENLAPLASSGRTSLKADPSISRDSYRIAGFRLCGDRAVRVDIVERLADMIRAAAGQPTGRGASKTSPGFVVTPQMTSLAGCSGEQFASILRSLGYIDATIRRSEFVQSSKPAAPAGHAETAAPTPVEAAPESSSLMARDDVQPATDDSPHPLDESLNEGDSSASDGPSLASATPPESAPAPEALATAEATTQVEAPAGAQNPAEVEASTTVEPPAAAVQGTIAEPDKSPKEAATASREGDEMIIVWRRAPRFQPGPAAPRSAGRRPERQVAEATTNGTTTPHAAKAEVDRPRFRRRRHAKPDATGETGARPAQSGPGQPAPRPESAASPEKDPASTRPDHRRSASEAKAPARARQEAPKPVVNMDSPFAKLLELRPLLAKENKKRS